MSSFKGVHHILAGVFRSRLDATSGTEVVR